MMARANENQASTPARKSRSPTCPGVISVHELYTLEEARKRLRWTESSMRAARRRGLRLLSSGKRKYVTGREIIRFLENRQDNP